MNGTAQEFQKLANQYNAMVLDTWSAWTKQTIQSESFTATTSAVMDWSLASHKMMTDLSGQVMETLDIPRRSDLARISSQVQSVETRLLEQEDHQEDIRELLSTLIAKIDGIAQTAKVEAVPATQPEIKTGPEPAPVPETTAKAVKPRRKSASKAKKTTGKAKTVKAKAKSTVKKASLKS
jgi:hypothetical protein